MLLKLHFGEQVPIDLNFQQIKDYQQNMMGVRNVFDQINYLLATKNIKNTSYKLITLNFGQTVIDGILKWCSETIEKLEAKKGEQIK